MKNKIYNKKQKLVDQKLVGQIVGLLKLEMNMKHFILS